MMQDNLGILRHLRKLSRRARLIRAALCALRFFLLGLILAIPLLILKGFLSFPLWLLIGFAGGLALLGALYGALAPLSLFEVAKLADSRLHFEERLATAFECYEQRRRGSIVEALLRDTASAVQTLPLQQALPFRPRLEGWALFAALFFIFSLWLPPLPFWAQEDGKAKKLGGSSHAIEGQQEDKVLKTVEAQRRLEQWRQEERTPQVGLPFRHETGEEFYVHFQDTKLSQHRQDFRNFLEGADEHLKLLDASETLSDPGRHGVQALNQPAARRAGEKLQALKPGGQSEAELQQLLKEIRRLGKESLDEREIAKSAAFASKASRPPEQFWGHKLSSENFSEAYTQRGLSEESSSGQSQRSGELSGRPSQRGMSKEPRPKGEKSGEVPEQQGTMIGRRSLQYQEKGPKGLGFTTGPHTTQEYIEAAHSGPGGTRSGASGGGGMPGEARKKGEAEGTFPGMGRSPQTRGLLTSRLGGPKFDTALPSEVETYQANIPGPGAKNPSRLSAQEVLSQYQRVMEEALSKEAIPFASREQVRDYFLSLEHQ